MNVIIIYKLFLETLLQMSTTHYATLRVMALVMGSKTTVAEFWVDGGARSQHIKN